jgi:hypothetical protein
MRVFWDMLRRDVIKYRLLMYGDALIIEIWTKKTYCLQFFKTPKQFIRRHEIPPSNLMFSFTAVRILNFTLDYFMCDIPCIFVYDCNNFTNTCTFHLFIMHTCLHVSASPGHHQGVTDYQRVQIKMRKYE